MESSHIYFQKSLHYVVFMYACAKLRLCLWGVHYMLCCTVFIIANTGGNAYS